MAPVASDAHRLEIVRDILVGTEQDWVRGIRVTSEWVDVQSERVLAALDRDAALLRVTVLCDNDCPCQTTDLDARACPCKECQSRLAVVLAPELE